MSKKKLLAALAAQPDLLNRCLLLADAPTQRTRVTRPDELWAEFLPLLQGFEVEKFAVIALNVRHVLIDKEVLCTGTFDCTIVDPRQVMRWALTRMRPIHSLAVAHNHPSNQSGPSTSDDSVTQRLAAACKAVGIHFLDHIIMTDSTTYYSYARDSGVYMPSLGDHSRYIIK